MDNRKFVFLVSVLALALFCGCTQPQAGPTEPVNLAGARQDRVMEVSEDVLRGMHFVIDKMDVDKGIIRTKPLTGGQYFEFWRNDNVTAYATAEANLHSIRRSVDLEIYTQNGELFVKCDVNVKRLSIPEMEFAGMSQAAATYTASDSTLQKLELNTDQAKGMAWIDLGSDPDLEKRILDLIHEKVQTIEGIN